MDAQKETSSGTAMGKVISELKAPNPWDVERREDAKWEDLIDKDLEKRRMKALDWVGQYLEPLQALVNEYKQIQHYQVHHSHDAKNLIQSYRVHYNTKGRGNPSPYGYVILDCTHMLKEGMSTKLVVLYDKECEREHLHFFTDSFAKMRRKKKWFQEKMNDVIATIDTSASSWAISYDSWSQDNLNHMSNTWEPFDEYLDKIANDEDYKVMSFADWRKRILLDTMLLESFCYKTMLLEKLLFYRYYYTLKTIIRICTSYTNDEVSE